MGDEQAPQPGARFNGFRRLKNIMIPVSLAPLASLSAADKLVYGFLRYVAGNSDECVMKLSRIAEELGLSSASVQRSINSLVDEKLIERRRSRYASSIIFLWAEVLEGSLKKPVDPERAKLQFQSGQFDQSGGPQSSQFAHSESPQSVQNDSSRVVNLHTLDLIDVLRNTEGFKPEGTNGSSATNEKTSQYPSAERSNGTSPDDAFDELVRTHPQKYGIAGAQKVWQQILTGLVHPEKIVQEVLVSHRGWRKSERWLGSQSKYCPTLPKWLTTILENGAVDPPPVAAPAEGPPPSRYPDAPLMRRNGRSGGPA